ncbi:hypothetical protein GGF37_003262, partial [Kickxella alabastrina]
LHVLRLQLTRCHSAYECAKSLPELGPLLTTLARSRVVAQNGQMCRAVVGTAMEYSKVLCQGVYSNQKASAWLSQLVKSMLGNPGQTDTTLWLQNMAVSSDHVNTQRFILRHMVQMVRHESTKWDRAKCCQFWREAFSLCGSDEDSVSELVAELIPGLDETGWAVLEGHELVASYGVILLLRMPLEISLELWGRMSRIRAQLVFYILSEPCTKGLLTDSTACSVLAGDSQLPKLLHRIFAADSLASQFVQDISKLVLATRDTRVVDMWKRVCRKNLDAMQANKAEMFGGHSGGHIVELFGSMTMEPAHLKGQWDCVLGARHALPVERISLWLGVVAVASDDFSFAVLDWHFGAKSMERLGIANDHNIKSIPTRQESSYTSFVIGREIALEVAAFAWAPLSRPAVAKSSVLAEWALRSSPAQQQ